VEAPVVLVERSGARVNVILNRPERKNSVTAELAAELRDAFRGVSADASVGCVVLQGAGGFFCSGIDLTAAGDGARPGPIPAWTQVHAELYKCPVPVVVALERYAINAGAALALGAHVVVAGESAFVQVSEIAIGVAAPMNQAWLHLRHSPAVADRMTLLADRIPAPELLRLGVVTEVVADDAVLARANELADRIAAYPATGREGIARTWRNLRGVIEDPDTWFASLVSR
jgi:enoyl-CoA hydratase/carnithine racemase